MITARSIASRAQSLVGGRGSASFKGENIYDEKCSSV